MMAKMSDKKKKHTKIYVEHNRQNLRRLQYWFAGFKAAGGKLPNCVESFDAIQAAIMIMHDYNENNND
jgi:hypothetical protein